MLPFFTSLARLVLLVYAALLRVVINKGAIIVPTCIPGHGYLILYNLTGGRVHPGSVEDAVGLLVLTTTGRKSGVPRSVSLVYIRDGSSYVVAASNAGRDRHPGWYFNLQSSPQVTVRIKKQQIKAVAEVASPAQKSQLWEQLVQAAPFFAGYPKRTRREIPMVLLHPVDEAGEKRAV